MGLIPARAGNTGAPVVAGWFGWAHPRSRGEHPHAPSLELDAPGSSPLARGTLGWTSGRSAVHGLIPARAGNTLPADRAACNPWAHPRSRGEHTVSHSPLSSLRGSSPLARGTRGVRASRLSQVGLIPARAGNTAGRIWHGRVPGAHPRSRGEHIFPIR